ncbi:MAG: hypothetical protein KAS38_21300 [Anaerolineales bacterium]|nr:hypothetical protein [Anaerolineales bacterium]
MKKFKKGTVIAFWLQEDSYWHHPVDPVERWSAVEIGLYLGIECQALSVILIQRITYLRIVLIDDIQDCFPTY